MHRWLKAQLTGGLYDTVLHFGMRAVMALLWCVKGEDPLEAAGSIVVLEG